ncbi:MAG: helix-turn-helix domain-containing protein [Bryobacteraceae bacterium]
MYPNLKLQLWKSGIRQNRLARMLDLDETVLSKILNGFRVPSPETRERIAALLNCDEDWLFESVQIEPESAPIPPRHG